MDIYKFFKEKSYKFGEIISLLILDLYKEN